MLRIRNLESGYGSLKVLRHISIHVRAGEIVTIIGANGAGKTTLLKTIAGLIRPRAGEMLFGQEDITRLSPEKIVFLGCSLVPEGRQVFAPMTVRENLMMVPPRQSGEKLWNALFSRSAVAEEEERIRQKADEVLEFLTISHIADQKAGMISGGQKKLVELGRTMMVDAKIVFLDEVGAGVNRTLLNTIGDAIVRLNKERGYTFCVIEHDMDFIARLCDPVICMAEGKVLAEGTVEQVKNDERVIEAYLGRGLKNKIKEGAA